MRKLAFILSVITLIFVGCNTFRALKRAEHEQTTPLLNDERLNQVQEVIDHLAARDFEEAQDRLSELYDDLEVGEDPVLEILAGVNQLLLNNPERAKYHLIFARTLIDSGHVLYANQPLNTTFPLNEKTKDIEPPNLDEDASIVAAFKHYVLNKRDASYLFDILKERSRIIPFPPTFLGPCGLVFEVMQEDLGGKPYFVPQLPDYPQQERDMQQLKQDLAINLMLAGIMSRDIDSVRKARYILLSVTSHPNNLARFHIGFSGWLLDAEDYGQYLFFREREIFSK